MSSEGCHPVTETTGVFLFQVLTLLLLSTPQALRRGADLEVPLWSPVFSLLFYLVFLVLSAIHVIVCTSATSSCYLCSLPWLVAGGLMVLVSALLCAIVSTLTRTVIESTLLRKVGCVHVCPCYVGQTSSHQTLVEHLACASITVVGQFPGIATYQRGQLGRASAATQASGILTARLWLSSGPSPLFSVEKKGFLNWGGSRSRAATQGWGV